VLGDLCGAKFAAGRQLLRNLAEAIAKKKVILFAGGGVSAAIGLPTYEQLLARLASELGLEPAEFMGLGDYRELAEYYLLEKGSLGALRRFLDIEWHSRNIDISQSPIHNAIVDLDFPLIYTTNYDRWLESAFDARSIAYTKITNVKDLLDVKSGATQIIKFHGDFDDDNSLVFAESAFLERLELESPLDIKLRADTLGKSILFIGYSLSDINMRFLLYKLNKLWDQAQYAQNRPKSYFFMARPNVVQERILESRGIISIPAETADSTKSLALFLTQLLDRAKVEER
jgi:hypothetical protein